MRILALILLALAFIVSPRFGLAGAVRCDVKDDIANALITERGRMPFMVFARDRSAEQTVYFFIDKSRGWTMVDIDGDRACILREGHGIVMIVVPQEGAK